MASASASQALTIASLCSASCAVPRCSCAAGRAQPQHESPTSLRLPRGTSMRRSTAHQPWLSLLVPYRPLARSHPKHEPGDTKDASQRAGRNSTLLLDQPKRLLSTGRASHWALNGRKRSAFEFSPPHRSSHQAFQPREPLLGPKQGPRRSKKRLRKLSAQGL